MLSLFSIPKPFQGAMEIIQKNAIESWRLLHSECEVFLFGDEWGTEKAAREFGAIHIPNVVKNEFGTPLLQKVFYDANKSASYPLLCYLNTDIILFKDIINAADRIHFNNFLMTGQRWDMEINERIDFSSQERQMRLYQLMLKTGVRGAKSALDYFLFPRNSRLIEIPAFAVGRPGWDNWFIFRARQLRIPVIDATDSVPIIHQNHDYAHVPAQRGKQWEGPEADWNRNLIGDQNHIFTLLDATHVLQGIHIKTAIGYRYIRRRWQTLAILFPQFGFFIKIISKILNLFKTLSAVKMKRN
ncbi:MAG: hypothetical protein EHM45_19025 [Desulfobacteraceae bacterium]|nr:MAG: hypothetical protein EHM45_19025 [Desulfobacteraceae bacterium]